MATPTPASELASLTLKEGVDISDESSDAYKIWQDTITTISRLEGYRGLRYGATLENPVILELVIDWDSVDSHKKFMASPEYRPFNDHLSKIVTATKLYHFHPSPCPPSVLDSAPVVEMAMFFGASDDFNSNVGKFMEGIEAAEGKQGYSHGPVLEELSKDEDQKPAKAVQLCIGWESVEAHMKFRETDLFQEHIHYLRKGTSGARLHHTSFTTF